MSDPVTNAEVEDVLSSIRRLVSEDKRPLQLSQGDRTNERLVLTPALRVAEDQDAAEQEVAHHDMLDGQASMDTEHAHLRESQDEADEHISNDTPQADVVDDLAQDYSEDPYNFAEDEVAGEVNVEGLANVLGAKAEGTDHADGDHAGSDHADGDHADGDYADAGQTESDRADSGDWSTDQEDDTAENISDDETLGGVDPESAGEAQDRDETEEHEQHTDDEHDGAPESIAAETDLQPASKADALRAKITELEVALGGLSANWAASGEASDTNAVGQSEDAMAWEDESPEDAIKPHFHSYDAEQDTQDSDGMSIGEQIEEQSERRSEMAASGEDDLLEERDTQSQEAQTTQEPVGLDYAADGQLIDEEVLRDMVSEIVRAELQGALGERITRNVRKLVRREIHRALTAQDLE